MNTSSNLIHHGMKAQDLKSFCSYAEFKRIFDNLDRLVKNKKLKSLSFLSFYPEEGRSSICAAVAIGLTQMLGYRVLLVDAGNSTSAWDINDIFGHEVSERLEQEGMVHTLMPNLDGMTLSRLAVVAHKAQEYRIQDIISEFQNRYDLILFDSSALKTTNRGNFDPWVIAARTDGSVLISSSKSGDLSNQFKSEPVLGSKVIGIIENAGLV